MLKRLMIFHVSVLVYVSNLVHAEGFRIELGDSEVVQGMESGVPVYPWFPDGHITILKNGDVLQMYWAGSSSYRTVGRSLESMELNPTKPVLSKGEGTSFDNGGAWLMSVHRFSEQNLLGFYHAEDHEWGHRNPDKVAWKSIAICESTNDGISWTKAGQIIASPKEKPSTPMWGGSGDFCVVYDNLNSQWVCYYQEHFLYMAISSDFRALPGSWFKYYQGGFTEPGLGGKESPIEGLKSHPGGNPSVHFNTYLKRWLMVWHSWQGDIVYSSSQNMTEWEVPRLLVSNRSNEKTWYATIIGVTDTVAARHAFLYYAYWPDKNDWKRQFVKRPLRFIKDK
ncbi:TPA: hypothetical protein EYN98_07320 [Candidatus Poribacteria bacterium]|nr:hypothetical protein [Candidatus Poribacteria bacterium]HIB86653.1 hypothetical protein [Candidatus Poribacteria bacterium]HIC01884.1 hypothetical protein [Candidatus Poribacteria bacterium]HIN31359.1 hypothetical protein [Candidatus Poribacteria bacterium]HIO50210.1 hypothetical protein [Candidatus Poribacteria bacterium]